MKVLTIRQPFASLIVEGHMPLENRPWRTRHRGLLLIHAAGAPPTGLSKLPPIANPPTDYPLSACIGAVTLDNITTTSSSPWYIPGQLAWHLSNPVKFPNPLP